MITDQIKEHTDAIWKLLIVAHEGRAWKPLGYSTWAEYVAGEFNLGKSRSYQLLDQAMVIRELESAVSTKVDISEREARYIKPVLTAVVDDIREGVTDLGPDPKQEDVQALVDDAVQAHRPVIKSRDTHSEERYFDSETGEEVAPPAKIPAAAPKIPKPVLVGDAAEQDAAEQMAMHFGRALVNLSGLMVPAHRSHVIEDWPRGRDAATPDAQELATPEMFRAIAVALDQLADEWEKTNV